MATLVTFHAHPDDEASQTAGLMAKAAAAGHRVVLVTATDGAKGEIHTELSPGETLAERRAAELDASARILGAELVVLGYGDSGMEGDPANADQSCFWQTDVEQAARRLADILTAVDADVLTIYDDHGGYGHPDHVQVHRVGRRAAEIAAVNHVFEATMNRDRIREMIRNMPADAELADAELANTDRPDADDFATIGTPAADISFVIDAREYAPLKRQALAVHDSQMPEGNFFLAMPDDLFAESFGYEHYNVPGVKNTGGPSPIDLLPGL